MTPRPPTRQIFSFWLPIIQGSLANIFNMMAQMNINITAINARTNKNGTVVVNLTLEITSVEILEKVYEDFEEDARDHGGLSGNHLIGGMICEP